MPKRNFDLIEEYQNGDLEQELLEILQRDKSVYQKVAGRLSGELFSKEHERFAGLEASKWDESIVEGGIENLKHHSRAEELVKKLAELQKRRLLAAMQQEVGALLFDDAVSCDWIVQRLETGLKESRKLANNGDQQRFKDARQLAREVLETARERIVKRKETGKAVAGISTGLVKLDQILNGWNTGLHVIAAGPGVGKTTLCLQFAYAAARQGYAAIYVSYENSPANLMLKLIGSLAQVSPSDVERGFGDVQKLAEAVEEAWEGIENLVLIEGTGSLRMERIEQEAELAMQRSGKKQCLIVFDYLQRAAHHLGYEQLRQNVSAMGGSMREMASRLNSPLIAISSQNRSGGDYGRGGTTQMDSLKESGDLEYGADTVLLLYNPAESTASPPAREVGLKIAKNRFGAVGDLKLIFRPDLGSFRERA